MPLSLFRLWSERGFKFNRTLAERNPNFLANSGDFHLQHKRTVNERSLLPEHQFFPVQNSSLPNLDFMHITSSLPLCKAETDYSFSPFGAYSYAGHALFASGSLTPLEHVALVDDHSTSAHPGMAVGMHGGGQPTESPAQLGEGMADAQLGASAAADVGRSLLGLFLSGILS